MFHELGDTTTCIYNSIS